MQVKTKKLGVLLDFGKKIKESLAVKQILKPDSTFIFNDLLLPVLQQKCGECHNDENKKGGLSLSSKEGFLKGGDHDEIFVAGNGNESEIFKRACQLCIEHKTFNKSKSIKFGFLNGKRSSFEKVVTDIFEKVWQPFLW